MYFIGCHHYTVYIHCIFSTCKDYSHLALFPVLICFWKDKHPSNLIIYSLNLMSQKRWHCFHHCSWWAVINLIPHLISCRSECATNPLACNKDNEHQSASQVCHSSVSRLASHVQGWRGTASFGLERDTEDRAAAKVSHKDINIIMRGN